MSSETPNVQPVQPELGVSYDEQAQVSDVLSVRGRVGTAIDGYKLWAEEHPYAATAVETTALFGVRKALGLGAKSTGLRINNGHAPRSLEWAAKHPLLVSTLMVAAAPIAEEAVLRCAAPAAVDKLMGTGGRGEPTKSARYISALGFAAGHIGNPLTAKGRERLTVPVLPLIGSMNYDRLHRQRGLGSAILGHAVNNVLAVAAALPAVVRQRKKLAKRGMDA